MRIRRLREKRFKDERVDIILLKSVQLRMRKEKREKNWTKEFVLNWVVSKALLAHFMLFYFVPLFFLPLLYFVCFGIYTLLASSSICCGCHEEAFENYICNRTVGFVTYTRSLTFTHCGLVLCLISFAFLRYRCSYCCSLLLWLLNDANTHFVSRNDHII